MSSPKFGPVQLSIMRILWRRKRATAREVTDRLARQGPITHSTVQTLLRQLEEKGAVGHDVRERTFIYHPRVKEEKIMRRAAKELVDRMFSGSAGGLIAHLLSHERVSRKELEAIRALIDEKE